MSYTQYNYRTNEPREPPKCNYCNTPIKFTKDKETNRWIRYNMDGSPHTRQVCDAIKMGGGPAPKTNNVSTNTGTGAIDPHLNSLLIKVSDLQKKTEQLAEQNMELKQLALNAEKSAQTNATVIDNMAQKIELILQKTGYPEPQKLIKDMATAEMPPNKPNMVQVGGTYIGPKEENPEVINPMRLPKEATDDIQAGPFDKVVENIAQIENIAQNIEKHENNEAFQKTQKEITQDLIKDMPTDTHKEAFVMAKDIAARIFKDQILPAMEKTVPQEKGKPWTPISEMFTCDSCKTKSANGFEKYGTKICPDCNNEFENTVHQSGDIEKEEFDKLNTEYDY